MADPDPEPDQLGHDELPVTWSDMKMFCQCHAFMGTSNDFEIPAFLLCELPDAPVEPAGLDQADAKRLK